jgi:protein phosphatase
MFPAAVGRDDGHMESIAVVAAEVGAPPPAGVSSATGRGRVRNDDAVVCGPTWFAIADGMGGHADGDIASRVAVHVLGGHPAPGSPDDVAADIQRAHDAVCAEARRNGAHGMGATLVVAAPVPGGVAVAHVGDSRCYRLADGVLTLLTRDHSYVQELVDLGRVAADDARHHRLRHVVTRALGIDDAGQPDVSFVATPVGRLLLCSDGLTAELSHRTIGRVLAGIDDPQAAADRLVELATRAERGDDVTALVVDRLGDRP